MRSTRNTVLVGVAIALMVGGVAFGVWLVFFTTQQVRGLTVGGVIIIGMGLAIWGFVRNNRQNRRDR